MTDLWLINDLKVENLRNKMIIERDKFREENPLCDVDSEEEFLRRKFGKESDEILKEQIDIIKVGLRSKPKSI